MTRELRLTKKWVEAERQYWADQVGPTSPLDAGMRLRVALCDHFLRSLTPPVDGVMVPREPTATELLREVFTDAGCRIVNHDDSRVVTPEWVERVTDYLCGRGKIGMQDSAAPVAREGWTERFGPMGDLVAVTRSFLQSLQCPVCDGSGWINNTDPDPQHDGCAWCEQRDRFLHGDLPEAPAAPAGSGEG